MTHFNKRCSDYTDVITKYSDQILNQEIKAQADHRDTLIWRLEYANDQESGLLKTDLQYTNQFLFILGAEVLRRQIP